MKHKSYYADRAIAPGQKPAEMAEMIITQWVPNEQMPEFDLAFFCPECSELVSISPEQPGPAFCQCEGSWHLRIIEFCDGQPEGDESK